MHPKHLIAPLVVPLTLLISASSANADQWVRSHNILTMADGQTEPIDGYLHISGDGEILAVGCSKKGTLLES